MMQFKTSWQIYLTREVTKKASFKDRDKNKQCFSLSLSLSIDTGHKFKKRNRNKNTQLQQDMMSKDEWVRVTTTKNSRLQSHGDLHSQHTWLNVSLSLSLSLWVTEYELSESWVNSFLNLKSHQLKPTADSGFRSIDIHNSFQVFTSNYC